MPRLGKGDRFVNVSAQIPSVWRVAGRRRETEDTVTLDLVPPVSGKMPEGPVCGRFNMLYAFGQGEVPISISRLERDPDRLLQTIRSVGSVTRALCRLRKGDSVGVRGPFGRGWPMDAAQLHDVVFVAGGLGMAPLRGAVDHVLGNRTDYGQIALLYGARSPAELLFTDDLARWNAEANMKVRVTVDSAPAGWTGGVGLVTRLIHRLHVRPERTVAMVCGPEIMMRFAAWELLELGLDPERVFLSMERNMQCGQGLCGHCQLGPHMVCRDGPVLCLDRIETFFYQREL
jgi:NAD(P)H-flavin reductase